MKYRAKWARMGVVHTTRYYSTPEAAQAILSRRIGNFHYLGNISGDVFENGRCTAAPRNGGLVTIHTRED